MCALSCILASLHPCIFRFISPCLHPCILISSGSCVLAYILASSHPHILRFINVSLYTRTLIFTGSCVLVGILASSHPRIIRFVCVCWHAHILRSMCSQYKWLIVFSQSPSSIILGNCAIQFVNNLQILRTGQAFVLDICCTSRKIYQKQPLRVNPEKKLLKSRQNLWKVPVKES